MKLKPPKSIKKISPGLIKIEWGDGFSSVITLEKLREECPCANCRKDREEGSGKAFAIPLMKTFHEGMNDLEQLKPMGNYAVRAVWADGHQDGIYDWDYLRSVMEKYALSEGDIP